MKCVLGVDPGLTGALCILRHEHDPVVEDMPVVGGAIDAYTLRRWLDPDDIEVAAVEHVHAMPRQGVSSTFKFGCSYGVVLGVLAALEVPVVHVPPTVWTRHHHLGSDKDEHRRRCMETFPSVADLWRRKKDDGRADATLIALWAMAQ
jgi:Holliday junction resolvasome RuvABC endonuclease subunit